MTNKTAEITDGAIMLRNKLPLSPSKSNTESTTNCSAKPSRKMCRGGTKNNNNPSHLFKCHLCNFDTKSKNCFRVHLQGSHGVCEMYCCSYNNCNFESRNLQKLIKHLCFVHSDRLFTCKKCGNQFKTKNSLAQHIRTHSVKEQESPATITKYKLKYLPQQKCQQTRRLRLTCKLCKWKETPSRSLTMHTQLFHSITLVNLDRVMAKSTSMIDYWTENPVSVKTSTTVQLRNKTLENEVQYLCTKTSNVSPASISKQVSKNVSNTDKVGKADLKTNQKIRRSHRFNAGAKSLKKKYLEITENRKARTKTKSKHSIVSPSSKKKILPGGELTVKKKSENSNRKVSRKRKLVQYSMDGFENVPPLEWLAQNPSFKLEDFLRMNRFQRTLCNLEDYEVLARKTGLNGTVHYQIVWREPVLNSNISHENVTFDFDEEIDRLFFGGEGQKVQISPNEDYNRSDSQNQIPKDHDSEAIYALALALDHPYCKVENTKVVPVNLKNGMNFYENDKTEVSDKPKFKLVSNGLQVLVE